MRKIKEILTDKHEPISQKKEDLICYMTMIRQRFFQIVIVVTGGWGFPIGTTKS